MDTPLYHALRSHQKKERASFHTPGHKSSPCALPADLLSLDYTELPDTDSLLEADGAILAAEEKAAELFGVPRILFSAGGCTLCIQTMLFLAAPTGGTVIVDRVVHRSVIHTMALLNLHPVWLLPRADAGPGFAGRIQPQDVEEALALHPDAKAVFLTSPDYFGVLCDIGAISQICKKHQTPLLVDNAHGAHLRFLEQDLHPSSLGASAVACSAHKTLPVLTGGAWLNLNDPALIPNAKEAMALFASTSPSYPIMASLDLCQGWLRQKGRTAFSALEKRVAIVRQLAAELGLPAPQGIYDPTRLVFHTAAVGVSGAQAAEHFRRYGVEPEYADAARLVLIPTPFNTEEDFVRVEKALLSLEKGIPLSFPAVLPELPQMVADPRQAVFSPQEEIPLEKSVDRIAGCAACPCPPGIPVVMPGEKITGQIVEFLRRYGFFSIKVLK